jgi:single-strand DNA-binding protein
MSTLRNRVQLIGHLGAAPEIKILEGGAKVARMNLATNESYKLPNGEWKEEAMWHTITGWNLLADRMVQQLTKGSFVMIEGKLVNRSYTDAAGIKKYITEVRATSMMKLDKKDSDALPVENGVPDEVHDDGLPF